MFLHQITNDRDEVSATEGGKTGQAERAGYGAAKGHHLRARVDQIVEDALATFEQTLSGIREGERSRGAREERRGEAVLEPVDLSLDGRWRGRSLACSTREATRPHHVNEHGQVLGEFEVCHLCKIRKGLDGPQRLIAIGARA